MTCRAFNLLGETEKERGNYNIHGKSCGGRIPEGHGKLSFNKYMLSVYHKPGKLLGTGNVAVNILKTKMSLHGGRKEIQHGTGRSGKSYPVK